MSSRRRRGYHPWLFMLAMSAFAGAAMHGDVVVALVALVWAMWLVEVI